MCALTGEKVIVKFHMRHILYKDLNYHSNVMKLTDFVNFRQNILETDKQKNEMLFLIFKTCTVHLRNTSRIFLATLILDANIYTTDYNTEKPDTLT